jgi:LuxR family maltose regulon positive regulatory protein
MDSAPEKMEKFIALAEEVIPYASQAMGGCMSGMHELACGELAFFRGALEEAEKYFLDGLVKGREKDQYEIGNKALFYLLRIYLSQEDRRGVDNILRQLEEELEESLYLNRYFHYDIVMGWYYVQTGRKDRIAPWLKSDYEESELNVRAQALEKLVKAKYYRAEKRYPAALASLENQGNVDIFLMGSIETKALEAVCRYQLRDKEGAYRTFGEAYSLASPGRLFMPFTELGKDMRALAEAALRDRAPGLPRAWLEETRRNAVVYAKRLHSLASQYRTDRDQRKGISLSPREKEVLVGLSQGLTREEIAEAASISPNTVKSVTRSIYNKLGALNQADAVRIATEKGLLQLQ